MGRVAYLASVFDGLLCFPPIRVCPTVRIAILVGKIRKHRVEHPGINGSRGLAS